MNKFEFKEVLSVLEIPFIKNDDYPGMEKYICSWNDLNFSFNTGSYYCVVEGEIPLDLANTIYQKYPNNPYKIRVAGGQTQWNPIDWTKGKDYLEMYHIDTKEGLLIFILELQDYWAKKLELPEIYVKQYQDLLNTVSTNLVSLVNPSFPIEEWMKGAIVYNKDMTDTYQMYIDTINKANQSSIDKQIREALNQFDKTVNPFQNENISQNNLTNFFQNVTVNSSIHNYSNGMERNNCAIIQLVDIKSKNYVKYLREPDGFWYVLKYQEMGGENITVSHYFNNHSLKEKNGEIFYINLYNKIQHRSSLDFEYNLTNDLFGPIYGKKNFITLKEKEFILEKIKEAIQYAETITLDNINKIHYQKKINFK